MAALSLFLRVFLRCRLHVVGVAYVVGTILMCRDPPFAIEVVCLGVWRLLHEHTGQAVAVGVGGNGAVGIELMLPGGSTPEAVVDVGLCQQHLLRVADIHRRAQIVAKVTADAVLGRKDGLPPYLYAVVLYVACLRGSPLSSG